MSFPAILRNPGISDRFAHLRVPPRAAPSPSVSGKRNRRDDKEGKRWVRRKENARFVGNVHIVAPAKKDFSVPIPSSQPTFPEPLPNFLSRNNPIPAAVPTVREPASANAGRFSLSLKGTRRQLRNSGPRIELLVKELEDVILDWLSTGGIVLSPDASAPLDLPGKPIGSTDAVWEVSRTPLQLVWNVEDNAFTRYVVHCCARYHEVVSFSKDTSGQRLTYLLRPNVTRPTRYAAPTLDTPPVTDLSELSATDLDTESEIVSDRGDLSDAEGPSAPAPSHALSAIVEGSDASAPASPRLVPVPSAALDSDGWSVVGESDAEAEGDMSAPEPEGDLVGSVASLSVSDAEGGIDLERTPLADRRRQGPDVLRSRLLERQRRSASSPSRSPARRAPPRAKQRMNPAVRLQLTGRRSFYDYLFA
ncbi:hypothetical protein DICSQDRAFT_144145 [Dichomitus squalens LYAD-421 SS1]|uniref:uncharacterized protein n=1 Tax=Dichomitus squalens (strain LYAD-421) TaxID=732165 RepID=UPI0004414F30|nr:uncharacterized protein DICSQDRAFT_144145 [Dichomitus squalens LYAD-421 SS1]EJF65508.1 hypothetical protein DICSQDRAFT_144145 [Dichomitus squalens LYAD-421 SS1]